MAQRRASWGHAHNRVVEALHALRRARTEIIYIPIEEMPRCPDCGTRMVIKELLDEGKST